MRHHLYRDDKHVCVRIAFNYSYTKNITKFFYMFQIINLFRESES